MKNLLLFALCKSKFVDPLLAYGISQIVLSIALLIGNYYGARRLYGDVWTEAEAM